jgi:hypothetical protein
MQELGGELVIRSQPLTENLFNIALHQGLAHLINKDQGIDVKPAWIKAKDAPDPVRKVLDNVETLVGYVDGFRVSWDNNKGLVVNGTVNWKNGVLESKRADILKKYNELTGKSLSQAEFDRELIAEIKGQTIDQIKIKGGVIGYAAIAVLMVVSESDGKTIDLTKVQLAADKLRGERYGVVVTEITVTPMPIATGEVPIATGETNLGTPEMPIETPAAVWPTVVPSALRVDAAKQFIPDIKAWETARSGADPQDVVATAFDVYPDTAVSILVGALFDADPNVRAAAIGALVSAKDKLGANKERVMQAVNVLASNDPDATVKGKAGDALAKILAYNPPVRTDVEAGAYTPEYAPAARPTGVTIVEEPDSVSAISAKYLNEFKIAYIGQINPKTKKLVVVENIRSGKIKNKGAVATGVRTTLMRDFILGKGVYVVETGAGKNRKVVFIAKATLKNPPPELELISDDKFTLEDIAKLFEYKKQLIEGDTLPGTTQYMDAIRKKITELYKDTSS